MTLVGARFVCCSCGDAITPEQAVNARVFPECCRACARNVQRYIASVERRAHLSHRRLTWEQRFARAAESG